MAYMRDDFYVWGDGDNLHIHDHREGEDGESLTIPYEIFDELAAMYYLRLPEDERQQAAERAYEKHGGNFGCEGVAKHLGKPSGYDMLEELLRKESDEDPGSKTAERDQDVG